MSRIRGEVSVEQIGKLPKSSWDLPSDEVYVQLGCTSCINGVCFRASGVTSALPGRSINPDDANDLWDILDQIEKKETIHQGSTSSWVDSCADGCREEDDITTAVEMLNDRFGSEITIQVQG